MSEICGPEMRTYVSNQEPQKSKKEIKLDKIKKIGIRKLK